MSRILWPLTDRISTRRGAWITVAIWAAITVCALLAAQRYPAPQAVFTQLPSSAEASRAEALAARALPQVKGITAIIVYNRKGGLTLADRARARSLAAWLRSAAAPRAITEVSDPFSGPPRARAGLISRDRSTLLVETTIRDRGGTSVSDTTQAISARAGNGSGGLIVRVTGPAAILTDALKVFNQGNNSLEIGTVLLVLVILGLVYRAPLLAILPVLAVGWSYLVAISLLTIGEHVTGAAVDGEAAGFVTVLLFGAGTDYTLFIISRYRPELTRQERPADAMRTALRVVAEPVLAGGGVVFLGTLTLTLASLPVYHDFGVTLGVGILCALLAGLTLIPALLTLFGRAAFWPSAPGIGQVERPRIRLWERAGAFVTRRPLLAVASSLLLLGVLASGATQYQARFSLLNSYLATTPSRQGFDLLQRAFGGGALATTQVVVVPAPKIDSITASRAVQMGLNATRGVSSVLPAGESRDRRTALLQVTLQGDPYAPPTLDLVPTLRERARRALQGAGGGQVLIGGETAGSYDARAISDRDTVLVVISVLVLIAAVLGLLLRSLLAPLYLLLINALSYGAALGMLLYLNVNVLGSPTASYQLPLILFVFLAALGADYNIFLLSRVREEAQHHALPDAIRRSVSVTGGVITSAGIILAGTFSVLATFPIRDTVEVGLGVALGVLLDTFVVRTLLVPGVTLLLGRNAWWPNSLIRHDQPEETPHGAARTSSAGAPW